MLTFIEDNILWLGLLALAIIIGLAVYALQLVIKLKKQSDTISSINNERATNIVESIKTICDATIQQQCSISEASVRLVALLQLHPSISGKYDDQLSNMINFYNKIQHHPILENRQNTPKKIIRKLDLEREELESQYENKILTELEWLKSQAFD